jgi:hypothetical protein
MPVDAVDLWREKTDEELLKAAARLDDYLPEGREIIRAELERRGLSLTDAQTSRPDAPAVIANPHYHPIAKLWHGEYSLPIAYWIGGWVINFALAALAVFFLQFETVGPLFALIGLALVVTWLLYAVVVQVGVWRSAGRYTGNPVWAALARAGIAMSVAMAVIRFITVVFGLTE